MMTLVRAEMMTLDMKIIGVKAVLTITQGNLYNSVTTVSLWEDSTFITNSEYSSESRIY